ncbi:MAG: hypothetical protein ACXVAT_17790, partial [Isosphaeraceae bacterium]
DRGCPSPRPVARRLETLGRPNGSGLETLAERNADRRPLANRRPLRHLLLVRLPVLQSSGAIIPWSPARKTVVNPSARLESIE